MQRIMPCLWFDGRAEEAAQFYTSIFKDSKVGKIARYGDAGPGAPGTFDSRRAGVVIWHLMTGRLATLTLP